MNRETGCKIVTKWVDRESQIFLISIVQDLNIAWKEKVVVRISWKYRWSTRYNFHLTRQFFFFYFLVPNSPSWDCNRGAPLSSPNTRCKLHKTPRPKVRSANLNDWINSSPEVGNYWESCLVATTYRERRLKSGKKVGPYAAKKWYEYAYNAGGGDYGATGTGTTNGDG
jgi:hypothetical protein